MYIDVDHNFLILPFCVQIDVVILIHKFINRAMQQEQKEMQLRLQQEYDPGNPDWQFIQMIRYVHQLLSSEPYIRPPLCINCTFSLRCTSFNLFKEQVSMLLLYKPCLRLKCLLYEEVCCVLCKLPIKCIFFSFI